jgi:hypothetical protein
MLVCDIPKELSLSLLDIPIRIMQDAKLKEEALRAHVMRYRPDLPRGNR